MSIHVSDELFEAIRQHKLAKNRPGQVVTDADQRLYAVLPEGGGDVEHRHEKGWSAVKPDRDVLVDKINAERMCAVEMVDQMHDAIRRHKQLIEKEDNTRSCGLPRNVIVSLKRLTRHLPEEKQKATREKAMAEDKGGDIGEGSPEGPRGVEAKRLFIAKDIASRITLGGVGYASGKETAHEIADVFETLGRVAAVGDKQASALHNEIVSVRDMVRAIDSAWREQQKEIARYMNQADLMKGWLGKLETRLNAIATGTTASPDVGKDENVTGTREPEPPREGKTVTVGRVVYVQAGGVAESAIRDLMTLSHHVRTAFGTIDPDDRTPGSSNALTGLIGFAAQCQKSADQYAKQLAAIRDIPDAAAKMEAPAT